MGLNEALSAETASVRAYTDAQLANTPRIRRLGIDVTPYIGSRVPGYDANKMLGDPRCILKDTVPEAIYLWRTPDDVYTKSMVDRGLIRPVFSDDLDRESPYLNVHLRKTITKDGVRQVVQTPGGLGLFVCSNSQTMKAVEQGLLPDRPYTPEHAIIDEAAPIPAPNAYAYKPGPWEKSYYNDLAAQDDSYAGAMEQLSQGSTEGKASGSFTVKDTQREAAVG